MQLNAFNEGKCKVSPSDPVTESKQACRAAGGKKTAVTDVCSVPLNVSEWT